MTSMETLNRQMREQNDAMQKLRAQRTKTVQIDHQLSSQVTENETVRKELALLGDASTVYKLIGPVLVSQDKTDAKAVIEKRLEYLNNEVKKVEELLKDMDRKEEAVVTRMRQIQEKAQELSKTASHAESTSVSSPTNR